MPVQTPEQIKMANEEIKKYGFGSIEEAQKKFNIEPSKTGITLPDSPNATNLGGKGIKIDTADDITSKLTASKPAIDEKDIRRQVESSLSGSRAAIESRFGSRIADATESAQQQERSLEGQLGTRRRFSSSAKAFIDFVDEKNKKEIADLAVQKEAALAEFDFKMAELVEKKIQSRNEQAQKEFDNMFKILEYANKQEAEAAKKPSVIASREAAIVDLYKQGITDTATLSNQLNFNEDGDQIGDITLEEINNTISKFSADKKLIDDIVIEAAKNGAPPETINKIKSARNLAEAVNNSDFYLQTGSGIVAEYNYYKRDMQSRGYTPVSFNEYQTQDANRKISISKAGVEGTGLNTTQQAVVNSIINKYTASPAIKALDKVSVLRGVVENIRQDPSDPAGQLSLIYSFIKGLDTDSAVKEGEIDLVKSINSYLGNFKLAFDRVTTGKPISATVALQIADESEKLIKVVEDTALAKRKQYAAQAKINGTQVSEAWKNFEQQLDMENTSPAEDESVNESRVTAIGTNNPAVRDTILNLVQEDDPTLGRPLTYTEVYQWLQANGYAQ